jgi:hypothetical protein
MKLNFKKIISLQVIFCLLFSIHTNSKAQVASLAIRAIPAMAVISEEIGLSALANIARTKGTQYAVQVSGQATAELVAVQTGVNSFVNSLVQTPAFFNSTVKSAFAMLSAGAMVMGQTLGLIKGPTNLDFQVGLKTDGNVGYVLPSNNPFADTTGSSSNGTDVPNPFYDSATNAGPIPQTSTMYHPEYPNNDYFIYNNQIWTHYDPHNPTSAFNSMTWYAQDFSITPITGTKTIDELAQYLASQEIIANKPITDEAMAGMANKVISYVQSQPGYTGPRIDLNNPITAQDIRMTGVQNPTIADTLAPFVPGTQTVNPNALVLNTSGAPLLSSATNPGTGTTTPPPTGTTPPPTTTAEPPPPVVGNPSLEATPTMGAILDPMLNLMPTLKHFQMPTYTATCPPFSFHFNFLNKSFGGDYVYHCQLASQYRDIIRNMMIGFTTILIIFIFLGV